MLPYMSFGNSGSQSHQMGNWGVDCWLLGEDTEARVVCLSRAALDNSVGQISTWLNYS